MAIPLKAKRNRKLPRREVLDADLVAVSSSSQKGRLRADELLFMSTVAPSQHDRTILSELWGQNENATRDHSVISSSVGTLNPLPRVSINKKPNLSTVTRSSVGTVPTTATTPLSTGSTVAVRSKKDRKAKENISGIMDAGRPKSYRERFQEVTKTKKMDEDLLIDLSNLMIIPSTFTKEEKKPSLPVDTDSGNQRKEDKNYFASYDCLDGMDIENSVDFHATDKAGVHIPDSSKQSRLANSEATVENVDTEIIADEEKIKAHTSESYVELNNQENGSNVTTTGNKSTTDYPKICEVLTVKTGSTSPQASDSTSSNPTTAKTSVNTQSSLEETEVRAVASYEEEVVVEIFKESSAKEAVSTCGIIESDKKDKNGIDTDGQSIETNEASSFNEDNNINNNQANSCTSQQSSLLRQGHGSSPADASSSVSNLAMAKKEMVIIEKPKLKTETLEQNTYTLPVGSENTRLQKLTAAVVKIDIPDEAKPIIASCTRQPLQNLEENDNKKLKTTNTDNLNVTIFDDEKNESSENKSKYTDEDTATDSMADIFTDTDIDSDDEVIHSIENTISHAAPAIHNQPSAPSIQENTPTFVNITAPQALFAHLFNDKETEENTIPIAPNHDSLDAVPATITSNDTPYSPSCSPSSTTISSLFKNVKDGMDSESYEDEHDNDGSSKCLFSSDENQNETETYDEIYGIMLPQAVSTTSSSSDNEHNKDGYSKGHSNEGQSENEICDGIYINMLSQTAPITSSSSDAKSSKVTIITPPKMVEKWEPYKKKHSMLMILKESSALNWVENGTDNDERKKDIGLVRKRQLYDKLEQPYILRKRIKSSWTENC